MKKGEIPLQEELAFSAIAVHALWPGRTSLYVGEVARALQMSEQQVIDLITEGELGAVNIAGNLKFKDGKIPRAYWRIPVSAFDAFVERRKNLGAASNPQSAIRNPQSK